MSVSPAEAVRQLRQRLEHRSRRALAAESAAKAVLPVLTQKLFQAGAKRVVLFGSLASGFFSDESDIDLAVTGVAESELARLERELTLVAKRPVEIASLDLMPPSLRASIDATGLDLR